MFARVVQYRPRITDERTTEASASVWSKGKAKLKQFEEKSFKSGVLKGGAVDLQTKFPRDSITKKRIQRKKTSREV